MKKILLPILALVLLLGVQAHAKPIHILVTGDMHGWLQPLTVDGATLGGAAEMAAAWKDHEGYKPEDFLVLSAGDVATGPALSTLYRGLPAVEVMNAMGYDASALGNHEFDFGVDGLKALRKLAVFPFLAANLQASGPTPWSPAAEPFCVIEKGGIKIGIIGLITSELPPYDSLQATNYAESIRTWAPKVRAAGAQVLLVLAHVPLNELRDMARDMADLNIPLMMGGHSHELGQLREMNSGTWIVNSGEWWKAYSRIDLDYEAASGRTKVLASKQVWLKQEHPRADPAVQAVVSRWRARLEGDPDYSRPLAYLASPLTRPWGVLNFVCDAWAEMDPTSDVVLVNQHALRQDLPPGPLNRGTLVSLLPFDDKLLRVKMTGRQLSKYLPKKADQLMGMAGLSKKGRHFVLKKTGRKIDPKASYLVLVNDYMIATSELLKKADPSPVLVANDWRDPILAWLKKHPSSEKKPLDPLLDLVPRISPAAE